MSAIAAIGAVSFIAWCIYKAPDQAGQAVLAGVWGLMAIATIGSILFAIFR